jgi:superfamily II DNA/RNA helicase
VETFQDIPLPEALQHTLAHMQFAKPTPIQSQAIPLALNGKDILGSAQTGTGKTGAYGIPLVSQLIENPDAQAMVITPTRELAAQVIEQLRAMLGKKIKNSFGLTDWWRSHAQAVEPIA